MINVSVHYPRSEGMRFDMDYYCRTHIPLARQAYGDALKQVTVLEALTDGAGNVARNVASAHLVFESPGAYSEAVEAHGAPVFRDVDNFTNITPLIEVSEIK